MHGGCIIKEKPQTMCTELIVVVAVTKAKILVLWITSMELVFPMIIWKTVFKELIHGRLCFKELIWRMISYYENIYERWDMVLIGSSGGQIKVQNPGVYYNRPETIRFDINYWARLKPWYIHHSYNIIKWFYWC